MVILLPLAVLLVALAVTCVIMGLLQAAGCFEEPALARRGRPRRMPPTLVPVGPEDDPAFLHELRQRIDMGEFRH